MTLAIRSIKREKERARERGIKRERKSGFGLTSELNKDAADMSAGDNVSLKYLPRNNGREKDI